MLLLPVLNRNCGCSMSCKLGYSGTLGVIVAKACNSLVQ